MSLPKHLIDKIDEFSKPKRVHLLLAHYDKMKDGGYVSDKNVYQCEGTIQRDVVLREGTGRGGNPYKMVSIRIQIDDGDRRVWMNMMGWDDVAEALDGCKEGTRISVVGKLQMGREWTNREGVKQPATPEILMQSVEVLGERQQRLDEPRKVDVKADPPARKIQFG